MNAKYNKILGGLIVLVLIAGGIIYFQSKKTMNQNTDQTQPTTPTAPTPATSDTPTTPTPVASGSIAVIDTNMGTIEVAMDAKSAPLTVANFVKLATEKYCDGTKFHRVLQDFVIQGCDPNSKGDDASTYGMGGPGYTVPAEIGLKANVGAIGMASTAAKGPSSGSQFFIVTVESADVHASLDGNYTFFGYVTKGMDVVTKIAAVPVKESPSGETSLPVTPVVINHITIK